MTGRKLRLTAVATTLEVAGFKKPRSMFRLHRKLNVDSSAAHCVATAHVGCHALNLIEGVGTDVSSVTNGVGQSELSEIQSAPKL